MPITAFAAVIELPTGVTSDNTYTHTYHTKLNITANVSVQDSNGNIIETTQVTKSGDFIEGNVDNEAVRAELSRISDEINTPFKSRGTVTVKKTSDENTFDHFVSDNVFTFVSTSGDAVDFGTDTEAQQYFNEHPDATGTFTKTLNVHEYQVYKYTYDLIVQTSGGAADDDVIRNIEIINATLSYHAGDEPEATALKGDRNAPNYEIEYEEWAEFEETDDGLVATFRNWFSVDQSFGGPFDSFEEGKTYRYSIALKAADGYTFPEDVSLSVNGANVSSEKLEVRNQGTELRAAGIVFIEPTQRATQKEIEVVEINNATLTFKNGDEPVFTGTTPENAPYFIDCEAWKTDDAGLSSSGFWNNEEHLHIWGGNLITTFDQNKIYTYVLYLKTTAEGSEDGWVFGPNTKLKVNGREVSFTKDIGDEYDQICWLTTNLTITPQAAGTSPDYKIIEGANGIWTQNSDKTLTFRANGDFSKFTEVKVDGNTISADKYIAASGSTVITLKAEYLKTLSVGTHTITVVYDDGECSTNFEIKASQTPNDENNPDIGAAKPQTGDSINILLWFVVLFVTGIGIFGAIVFFRKKKRME